MEALPDATRCFDHRSSTTKAIRGAYRERHDPPGRQGSGRARWASTRIQACPRSTSRLDGDGGELMHRATRHSVGRRMAVVFIETKTRDRKAMVGWRRSAD